MEPTSKKHVSHAIAWSLIALLAGSLAFGIWTYFSQISDIYDNSLTISFSHKKTTTKPTTATTTTADATADWKTYTNTKYKYSIKLPQDYGTLAEFNGDFISTISPEENLLNFGNRQVAKEGNSFGIYINNNNIDNIVKEYQKSDVTVTSVKIGQNKNIEAKKVVSNKNELRFKVAYLIDHNDNLYNIEDTREGNSIITTIISTFTFTK